MTPIARVSVVCARTVSRTVALAAGVAFVAGFAVGTLAPNGLRADAQLTLPQPVVAQVRQLTDHWCRDFGGLDPQRLYLVGPQTYSWWCHEFAAYHGVRIHTREGR